MHLSLAILDHSPQEELPSYRKGNELHNVALNTFPIVAVTKQRAVLFKDIQPATGDSE